MKPIFAEFSQYRFTSPNNYDAKKFRVTDISSMMLASQDLFNISIYNGVTNIHLSPRTILFPNMERKYINLEF